ncbi:MAG: hypothetical protein V1746_02975, partial [bacterium]
MKRLFFLLLFLVAFLHAAFCEESKQAETAQNLIQKGDSFYDQGEYERACALYEEAYRANPDDAAACRRMERIEKIKFKAATTRWEAERQNSLNQAVSLWSKPQQQPPRRLPSVTGATTSRVPQLLKKLETIRFPELSFQDADIAQVVQYLSEQSRKLDPEGKGVNFVFEAGEKLSSDATSAPPCAPVNLSLRNVSLLDALYLIKKTTTLNYQVEDYAVVLRPLKETEQAFVVRHFTVNPDFFRRDAKPRDDA